MSKLLKADFPIFRHHPKLVYLDSAATNQKPQVVVDAVANFYLRNNAAIHRGIYDLSQQATDAYEMTRGKVGRFINASSPEEIVFTGNATMAINLVAYGWGKKHLQPGDIVVVSQMEHHSNLVPWLRLKEESGIELFFLPVGKDYRLDYQKVDGLDMERVKLIALTHASNVLGTINPIAKIAAYFKQQGADAKLLVDAAQSAPHFAIDVVGLGADFLVFSAHKTFGPSGVGVLYAKTDLLNQMDPLLVGSHMISSVSQTQATWAKVPDKFEPGSPNTEGVIGLGAAINYIQGVGWSKITTHEKKLTEYGLEQLQAEAGLTLFGPAEAIDRLGIFSFEIPGIHSHDVAEILNRNHVAVRAGHHCAQPLMHHLGVTGTVRASLQLYNTPADIDSLLNGIRQAKKVFGV